MMRKKIDNMTNIFIMFCIYALIGWLYEVLWMRFVVSPHKWINRGVLIGPFLPIYGFGMLLLYFLLKKIITTRHPLKNRMIRNISLITIITFIFTTIIEYTTPKIYQVSIYLKEYGLKLFIINLIGIIMINLILEKTKNKKLKEVDMTIVLIFLLIWLIATGIEYISHFIMDRYFHIMLWDYTKDFLNVNKRINWDASRNFAIGGTFLLYVIQPVINKFVFKISTNTKLKIALIIGIPMALDFILHVILKIV